MKFFTGVALATFLALAGFAQAASNANWKFDFGSGTVQSGYTQVTQTTAYNSTSGYGFVSTSGLSSVNRSGPDALRSDYITGTSAFTFNANVPNGNYNITVTTGDNNGTSETTIKSEAERVLVEQLKTSAGQFAQYSVTVNIRDGVLNLTFSGTAPKVNAIEIQQTTSAITLFIAGDSTVCDQGSPPYAGWGQELSSYLKPGVAVANYADSGESSWSFWNGFYVPGIQPRIKSGDYLLIQFGHNDEKSGTLDDYKTWLKKYVDDARAHGATPILITPLERNIWSGGTLTHSHGQYPDAMKSVATANNVPLIDLTTMSYNLYVSMGQTAATTLFVSGDKTHTNEVGALKIAGLIRDGLRTLNLSPLVNYLSDGTPETPLPAGSNYQAENGTLSGSGTVVETTNAGYRGSGYVNLSASGGSLTFNNVAGNGGGTKALGIQYALGATVARTCTLTVNGVASSITFQPTGSWTTWKLLTVNVTLSNTNSNTVQISTNGADAGNIDYINVPPVAVAADVYQAESAALGGGAVAESTNSGYNGSGYANLPTTGGTVTFNSVNPNGGGTKALTIRFALGGTTARTGNLVVNGATTPITFQPTGAWTTWKTMSVNITLSTTSTNTIQLTSTGSDLANIDEISVPW